MRVGRRTTMLLGFALMAGVLVALDRVNSMSVATPLLALASACWTLPMANAFPLFVEPIPRQHRGVLAALFLLSMALGGAIGALAIFLKVELLLLLVGGIFVIEALSVMLQVVSFKYWGRRVFLMAPLHHHFEMKAWSETKIMVRFWIVGAILSTIGFVLFYRYYLRFKL